MTTTTNSPKLTVAENLIAASAAFAELAPKEPPANPSVKLAKAFKRFLYWHHRMEGGDSWVSCRLATIFQQDFMAGKYVTTPDIWEKIVADAVDWSSRPAR